MHVCIVYTFSIAMQYTEYTYVNIYAVNSFLELVPTILDIPGVKFFLSDKLNQDPLENFFGCIRQNGRVNSNPTINEAMKSTQTLRVINSVRMDKSIKGNCRGRRKRFSSDKIDLLPLPKRQCSSVH